MTEFPETQNSLIAHIKSLDDREAWEEFVSLYRPVIYRIARRRGFQEADSQDLTQRVLASIANSIHRWENLETPVRFRHWLRRVVKNAIINAATRKPRDMAVGGLSGDDVLTEHLIEDNSDPGAEDEIGLEYRREVFRQAAAIVRMDVDPVTWQAFELSVIEGRSVDETAEMLGKRMGAVYAARSRVMGRLREVVQRMEGRR